jgi:hypothetical protein
MGIVDLEQLERNEAAELKQAQDALDAELSSVEKPGSVPEKYRGKSLEEVIAMNEELVRQKSRLGNEIGELRRYRETTELELQKVRQPQRKEVNVDVLLENPEEAVETVIGQSSKIRRLEEQLEKLGTQDAQRQFEQSYPDYKTDLSNDEFIEWATKNPVRRALAQAADKYDFTAANELWSLWQERQELVGQAEAQKKQQLAAVKEKKLRDGTLESGTGNSTETKKVFSRREIRDIKTRAIQGDRKAQEIVNDPEWQSQTLQAYFDKRAR